MEINKLSISSGQIYEIFTFDVSLSVNNLINLIDCTKLYNTELILILTLLCSIRTSRVTEKTKTKPSLNYLYCLLYLS